MIKIMYLYRFVRGMRKAGSNLYMGDAEETRLIEIRGDMVIYVTFD